MVSAHLVFDILVRLPVKTLLRFSCVSKIWQKMIITDPSFNAMHHSRATKTNPEYLLEIHCKHPCMRLISRCNELFIEQEVLQLPISSLTHPNMTVVGSCNGLLCLAASDDKEESFGHEIYLLNAAIRRLKLLPPSPRHQDDRWDLPPDSTRYRNPHHIGIGFDSLTADYKVVKTADITTTSLEHGWFTGAQVYSLRSNSWKTVTYFNSRIHIWWSCGTAFVNGAFYWLAEKESRRRNSLMDLFVKKEIFILSFDFAKETFKEIRLPESLYYEGNLLLRFFCMGEFKGKLYLMLNNIFTFEIWLMMEDSSWLKTFCAQRYGETFNYTTPFGLGMNNEIILLKRLRNKNNIVENLVTYDLDTGTLVDHGTREASKMFLYVPSLALLGEESQSFEEALSSKHFLLGHHQMV